MGNWCNDVRVLVLARKQYRMFGELVESATRSAQGSPLPPFILPTHAPPLPSKLLHPDAMAKFSDGRGGVNPPPGLLLPNANAVAVSILPAGILQPPGAYFYLAALCTVERRARFLKIASSSSSFLSEEDNAESSPLAHEREVDHTAQLTENLTKSYDAFKRARSHRSALFVAARIATAYFDGGLDEMALKFLERILKSYKKDEVKEVRKALVRVASEAAVRVGDGASVVRLLSESLDTENDSAVVEGLRTFLRQWDGKRPKVQVEKGEEEEKAVTITGAEWLQADTVFPASEVDFGAAVPFQLSLRNMSAFDLRDTFAVDSITLHLQQGEEGTETLVKIDNSHLLPTLRTRLKRTAANLALST